MSGNDGKAGRDRLSVSLVGGATKVTHRITVSISTNNPDLYVAKCVCGVNAASLNPDHIRDHITTHLKENR